MKQILLRADDLGYSEAVNYGLAKGCLGLPVSIGLMMNMPAVEHGYNLIKDKGYCLGVHTNISVGSPVCDPEEVPSLVEADGTFHSSKSFRSAKAELVTLEDVEKETEAQIKKFISMTSREPEYLDVHAVFSMNFLKGVMNVAQKYGIPCSTLPIGKETMPVGNKEVKLHVNGSNEKSLYDIIDSLCDTDCMILVFHPGYVDKTIMETSSVNIQRVYDTDLMQSEVFHSFIDKGVELITYRDLKG